MKKRLICLIFGLILMVSVLCSCSGITVESLIERLDELESEEYEYWEASSKDIKSFIRYSLKDETGKEPTDQILTLIEVECDGSDGAGEGWCMIIEVENEDDLDLIEEYAKNSLKAEFDDEDVSFGCEIEGNIIIFGNKTMVDRILD